jgi:predicted nucleotidyltransferase
VARPVADCRSCEAHYNAGMVARDDALRILRRHKAELRARGVRRAAVFGSVSRGEARADSDLDVLIEIDRPDDLTVYDFVGIKRAVAELFPGRVDVVDAAALKQGVGRTAKRDAVYAF